jgi:rod shape-determining protein MreC
MTHRRTFYIVIILFVVLLGHYLGLWRPVENLFTRIVSAPLAAGYSSGGGFFSFFNRFKDNTNLIDENKNLKEQVAALENEIILLKEGIKQSGVIAEQLEFLKQKKLKAVLAAVVTRGAENNPNQIILNKGSRDGIKNGFVVLGTGGVVIGRVARVEETTSQVLLLIDSNVEISAADVNGVLLGVVKGNKDLSLRLNYILKESKIAKGDLIITAGEKDLVPSGLLIAEVDQVLEDEREIFKSARLTQMVDFDNQRIVSVVLP